MLQCFRSWKPRHPRRIWRPAFLWRCGRAIPKKKSNLLAKKEKKRNKKNYGAPGAPIADILAANENTQKKRK